LSGAKANLSTDR